MDYIGKTYIFPVLTDDAISNDISQNSELKSRNIRDKSVIYTVR